MSEEQIGHLYFLLHRAIVEHGKAQYQPPHWDHPPTVEDKLADENFQEACALAERQMQWHLRQITMMLSGV